MADFAYIQNTDGTQHPILIFGADDKAPWLQPIAFGKTSYYRMRARDSACLVPTFVHWTVTGSPDSTGAQYTGSMPCGGTLADITIEAAWQA